MQFGRCMLENDSYDYLKFIIINYRDRGLRKHTLFSNQGIWDSSMHACKKKKKLLIWSLLNKKFASHAPKENHINRGVSNFKLWTTKVTWQLL